MDSLRRPVGSLPPGVYWRRRLLVLGAVVAVLALVLYACSGSGSSTPRSKSVGNGTPSSTASAAAGGATGGSVTPPAGQATNSAAAAGGTTAGTAGGTTAGTAGGTTAGAATAGGTGGAPVAAGTCQLSLTLTSRATGYANGEKPDFSVAVLNKGTSDCTADLGPKSLVLTVVSGPDRIWSSADCGGAQDLRAIAPGTLLQIPFTWSRVRSLPGCATPTGDVGLGTYNATATLSTGTGATTASFTSQQQSFQLRTGS